MDRDRDAWIMAATLLDRHGEEAAAGVISAQLATLHRLVELHPSAEDRAMLRFWRQTGEALDNHRRGEAARASERELSGAGLNDGRRA